MVFAEAFATNLCNEISTCYTVVIFIVGIIITLKIKLLDETKKKSELTLFIVWIIANIVFLSISFLHDCASISFDNEGKKIVNSEEVKAAVLLLNATIWIDFIILIRNLYLIVIGYFKKTSIKNETIEVKTKYIEKNRSVSILGIISLIGLAVILIALIVFFFLLRNALLQNENQKNDLFINTLAAGISGFCAIIGGVITLIGVRMTIKFEKDKDKKTTKEANKPQLYAPLRYKLNEINEISVNNGCDNSPIWQKKIVLKNSSKCSFKIIAIKVNEKDYNSNVNLCIEPDFLFGLCFNYNDKVQNITLKIESYDESFYDYFVLLENEKKVIKLEVSDASIRD